MADIDRLALERAEAMRKQREQERAERRAAWHLAHAQELELRRYARVQEKEVKRGRWQEDHLPEHEGNAARFEEEMAALAGISVAEFRAIQGQRRAEMQGKGPLSYSPDHEVK